MKTRIKITATPSINKEINKNAIIPKQMPNTLKSKAKVKTLKKVYIKPNAKMVGMSTQKSPVMGCWDCGEDGIHC